MHSHCQTTAFEQQQHNNSEMDVFLLRRFCLETASFDISHFENMSLSPSHQEEAASASPESPSEGDFSSRQFYDNLKSLEEHETLTNDLEKVRAGIFPSRTEKGELQI